MTHTDMHHQLLDVMGVPSELHDAFIANQREHSQLVKMNLEAVVQRADAIAQLVGERMGLPDGLSFRVDFE